MSDKIGLEWIDDAIIYGQFYFILIIGTLNEFFHLIKHWKLYQSCIID